MTNLCTKVTVRKRPIKNGQTSLYLDFYPPIRRSAEGRLQGKNPKTGRLSRREYLGLYIYSNPTEKVTAFIWKSQAFLKKKLVRTNF